MLNKKLLCIFLLFSVILIIPQAFAEDTADNNYLRDDSNFDDAQENLVVSEDNQVKDNQDSLDVVDVLEDNNVEKDYLLNSESKNKLSSSNLSSSKNSVTISDVVSTEGSNVIVTIKSRYSEDTFFSLEVFDADDDLVFSSYESLKSGSRSTNVNLGVLDIGEYSVLFDDFYGIEVTSNIQVNPKISHAKIKVSDYKSYFGSGKKLTVKTINKLNSKPISMKLKLIFKKTNTNSKVYYVTTNHNGVAKVNVSLSAGDYKLTICSASSAVKSNKTISNVKINKLPVSIKFKNIKASPYSYVYLNATVKDKYGNYINSGQIKFNVGKYTYKVNIKKGIAKMKVKFKSEFKVVGKASFSKTNYASKIVTNKIVIRYHTIKIGSYSCKLTDKDWQLIKDSKNKIACISKSYFTHKYKTLKYYTYSIKNQSVYKKKLYKETWYKNGFQQNSYKGAFDTPYGYSYYGQKIVSKGSHSKTYIVYKKTITKKIKSKPKYMKCKVYIDVYTYRWTRSHKVGAMACTHSVKLLNLDKDYNYYSKEKIL